MNRQINLKYVALFGFLAILIIPSVIIIYMRIILTEEVSRDLINTRLNKSIESNEQAISDIFRTAKGVSTVIADAAEANPEDIRLEQFNKILFSAAKSSDYIESVYVALSDGYLRTLDRVDINRAKRFKVIPIKTKWASAVVKSYKDTLGSRVRLEKYYEIFPTVLARNRLPFTGSDIRAMEQYLGAKNGNNIFTSSPQRKFDSGNLVVRMGVPITVNGAFSGIVGTDIRLEAANNIMRNYQASENSLTIILDRKKDLIVTTDNAFGTKSIRQDGPGTLRVSEHLALSDILKNRKEGMSHISSVTSADGVKFWVLSKILPRSVGEDLEMLIISPDDDFFAEVRAANMELIWLGVFLLFIGSIVIYYFSSWLGEKINKVTFASIRARERMELVNNKKSFSIKEITEFYVSLSEFERELASLSKNIQDDEKILSYSRGKKLQTFKRG